MRNPAPVIGITCGSVTARSGAAYYGDRQDYVQALQRAGAAVLLIPPGNLETLPTLLSRLDGVMLPGGADVNPAIYGEPMSPHGGQPDDELDALEIALVRGAQAARTPLLGICRGQQVINVALGGTLYQDLGTEYGTGIEHRTPSARGGAFLAHNLAIAPESRLARALGATELEVNSSHHQAVKRVAPSLRVTATSPDGVVEALESEDGLILTVQCHPERLLHEPWVKPFFADFLARAAARHA